MPSTPALPPEARQPDAPPLVFLPRAGSRVAVGLSGGVDSAMAAWLLKRAGCEVVALTMLTGIDVPTAQAGGESGKCRRCHGPGQAQAVEHARRVAERLGIPHVAVPLEKEFREIVLGYFREEYLAGRTPNPCGVCNRQVKFGLLIDRAREMGVVFDGFATGHYARIEPDPATGRPLLMRGADAAKDQSYFLSRLARRQLGQIAFPLGRMTKAEVRALAREAGFGDLADSRESQDFSAGPGHEGLFSDIPIRPGPVMSLDGRVLGRHHGIVFYTIGQRKGLGLGGGAPLYVVGLDSARDAVIVGPRERLLSGRLIARALNWLAFDRPDRPVRVRARIRQQHRETGAEVRPLEREDSAEVVFDRPQMSITTGQIVAFYQDDVVLGSGIIECSAGGGAAEPDARNAAGMPGDH